MDNSGKAFEKLIVKNQYLIHKVCNIYRNTEEDKEDLFQEIVMQLWRAYPSFKGDSKFTTWLYKVAMNTSFMYLRSKKKVNDNEMKIEDLTRFDESGNLQDVFLKDWSDVPEDKILSNEGNTKLEDAINELPEKYKAVFQLKDVEGLSNQEVADILDLSLPAVKSRALRARLFLREKLSDYYQEYI